ncbi:NFACT RNA binding domain-containing protein [Balneolaceae bacterium ANBcel3]|nr:NFACT RNA binding domain-containing protein [Balneolaceae bacterium ANBcel3]
MNNFYTLNTLVGELRYKIFDKEVIDVVSFKKNQIDIILAQEDAGKLTFSASHPDTALFHDNRSSSPSKNKVSVFPQLKGKIISDIRLFSRLDRWVMLSFQSSELRLYLKLFGTAPNVWLADNDHILASFKKNSAWMDRPVSVLNLPEELEGEYELINKEPDEARLNSKSAVKEKILFIDKRFPRGLIRELKNIEVLDASEPADIVRTIEHWSHLLLHPNGACITQGGSLCLLPEQELNAPAKRSFSSVNDAVRTLFLERNRQNRIEPRKKELESRVQRKLKNAMQQLQHVQNAESREEQAAELEDMGHYLMSRPDPESLVKDDAIVISGWSSEMDGKKIHGKPGCSKIQWAQRLYQKAAGLRKEASLASGNEKRLNRQIKEYQKVIEELKGMEHPSEFEAWMKKNSERLMQAGLGSSSNKQETRPYRLIQMGSYEVWIGKNAKSNDEMLSSSHKEDIWMHARGSAGSHVIIRNQGRADWPQKPVLLEAAAVAAAHSKQAGSALVPVQMAKRKHIRKPKGAAPGMVVVTNERVEMVSPKKP